VSDTRVDIGINTDPWPGRPINVGGNVDTVDDLRFMLVHGEQSWIVTESLSADISDGLVDAPTKDTMTAIDKRMKNIGTLTPRAELAFVGEAVSVGAAVGKWVEVADVAGSEDIPWHPGEPADAPKTQGIESPGIGLMAGTSKELVVVVVAPTNDTIKTAIQKTKNLGTRILRAELFTVGAAVPVGAEVERPEEVAVTFRSGPLQPGFSADSPKVQGIRRPGLGVIVGMSKELEVIVAAPIIDIMKVTIPKTKSLWTWIFLAELAFVGATVCQRV
jgi:hypothetical protein